jgi:hypothetical protein
MTRRAQGLAVIFSISARAFSFGRRVLPRARAAASSSSFLPALARVVPSKPGAWAVVQFRGVGEDGAAPGAVDVAAGVVSGQPAEPVLTGQGVVRCGQGEQVRAVAGRDGPGVGQPGLREVREVRVAVLPGVEDDGQNSDLG